MEGAQNAHWIWAGLRNEHRATMENFYKRNESVLPRQKQMVICASYQWVFWKGKAKKKWLSETEVEKCYDKDENRMIRMQVKIENNCKILSGKVREEATGIKELKIVTCKDGSHGWIHSFLVKK